MNLETLKFPIGQFQYNESDFDKEKWIKTLQNFPSEIEKISNNLSVEQLNWNYRPNGWCIKQVVHHCADSHMNSFIRFKLALTENNPIIKPYEEHLWAEMIDETDNDLTASILILKGVHFRWVKMLHNVSDIEWNRQFQHPHSKKVYTLKEALGLYAWHCNHHLAHIKQAIKYKGDFYTSTSSV